MLPADDRTLTWRLPALPSGGPEAAREVADVCDRLAGCLRKAAVTLGGVQDICESTTGAAGVAIRQRLHDMQVEHDRTADHFNQSAQTMRRLADDLERSRHKHHFSLSGMVKAGAIVVGGAALVYVTLPMAAPAAVAIVEAEVAVAEGAAAAATAATESAAAELSLLARAFSAVRGLCTVSRMQVVYGEVWLTAQSTRSEIWDDRILPDTSPQAIALDLAGMAVGAGAGKLAGIALAGRAGTVLTTVGTGTASAVGGAVPQTAYDWERTGSFPARGFAWDAAKGAGSSVISGNAKKLLKQADKWRAQHRPQPGKHRKPRGR